MTVESQDESSSFDFEKHEGDAVVGYLKKYSFYQSLANVVAQIIEECISHGKIEVHSVQSRAKDPTSFGRKASIPSETDVNRPKYGKPLEQITDLAGVRVITQFHGTLAAVDSLIGNEFEVVERSDKSKGLYSRGQIWLSEHPLSCETEERTIFSCRISAIRRLCS